MSRARGQGEERPGKDRPGGRVDEGWKSADWVDTYLKGIRGGIPLLSEQIGVMLRVIDGAVEEVGKILDLGCGDGVLSAAVIARHPRAEATLVDFSAPMLREARTRFTGPARKVNLVEADFSTPGWVKSVRSAGPFDAVVSGYAIHHQRDERKRELYGEILGLLRPGGVFLNMEHVASSTPWVRGLAEGHFSDSLRKFRESGATEVSEEKLAERQDKEANVLAPVEDQCRWLRELGYVDVDCFFKVFELALFGGRAPAATSEGR